jgi:integrase
MFRSPRVLVAARVLAGLTQPELAAAARAEHIKVAIVLLLATAGRVGAVTELPWTQLNFDSGLIDLGQGRGNKRRAVVPLTDEALGVLRRAKEHATTSNVLEWRGKPVKSVRNGILAAVRRAKLARVTPHVIRHTAATWMAIAGVPISEIARFLGISERVAKNVYAKHTPEYLRKASAALAREAPAEKGTAAR